MRISRLRIRNFRGIKSGEVAFGDLTALIGANNSGKTTIIEAIALLVGRDKLVRSLTEHDFFGSTPAPEDRISIIGTITHFGSNEPDEHTNWFRMGRGVERWLDADTGLVKAESSKPTDQLACQIALSARFDRETLEVETCRYFYDADSPEDPFDQDANVKSIPAALIKELGFFLVPASRTWDRMISFGSELFRRVVAYVGGQPAEAIIDERNRVRSPANPIEADKNLAKLVGAVDADILTLFGRQYSLKLRMTSTDSDGVLDSIVPHFASTADMVALPSRRQGSGLLSLQTLILLLRFGHLRVERKENFLMAIEEPELHVPPPLQRRLLHHIQSLTTQTILTTHSPTVAAVPGPHQIVLVVNEAGALSAKPLLKQELDVDADNVQRGLFLSNRDVTISALMQPFVLIPEGQLDAAWLRLLCRVSDLAVAESDGKANPSFTHEVGVVPTKDARVADAYGYLSGVHPSVFCLVDGDKAGLGYVNALCALTPPPKTIFQWRDGWAIENVIGWIVEADLGLLSDAAVMAAGLPNTVGQLVSALLGSHKANEIAHAALADAVARRPACVKRVNHVLGLLSLAARGGKPSPDDATTSVHSNGITRLWVFAS